MASYAIGRSMTLFQDHAMGGYSEERRHRKMLADVYLLAGLNTYQTRDLPTQPCGTAFAPPKSPQCAISVARLIWMKSVIDFGAPVADATGV
jgi:hypothetical protein